MAAIESSVSVGFPLWMELGGSSAFFSPRIPWRCVPDAGRRSPTACWRRWASASTPTVSAAAPARACWRGRRSSPTTTTTPTVSRTTTGNQAVALRLCTSWNVTGGRRSLSKQLLSVFLVHFFRMIFLTSFNSAHYQGLSRVRSDSDGLIILLSLQQIWLWALPSHPPGLT